MADMKNKQQNLLKANNNASKPTKKDTKKPSNPLVNKIKNTINSQNRKTIHYQDYKGNKKSRTITLNDAGIDALIAMNDFANSRFDTSNDVGLFSMIMNKVIADPSFTYKKEEQSLPESMKSKTVKAKNKSGEKVNINLVWPGYIRAIKITSEARRPSGAADLKAEWADLKQYVLKDDNGKSVTSRYFNVGGHCSGLGLRAIAESTKYLDAVLDHDGLMTAIVQGISFLQK